MCVSLCVRGLMRTNVKVHLTICLAAFNILTITLFF